MADKRKQTDLELKVFTEFMKRCGQRIDPASVAKRNPPEPDIFCKTIMNAFVVHPGA